MASSEGELLTLEVHRACRLGLGGVVQLWCRGEGLAEVLAVLLKTRDGRRLHRGREGDIQYGILTSADGPVDEVLVGWTPWGAELNCHGGTAAATAALRLLADHGFAEVTAAEWWRGEVVVGRITAIEAEVNLLMPKAITPLQVEVLTGVNSFIENLRALAQRLDSVTLPSLLAPEVQGWVERYAYAHTVLTSHRVAVVGAPNAGKSTTFNAILLRDRAMVSAVAGTTRDAVRHPAILGGLEVELIDTAGLLAGAEGADGEAVKRSLQVVAEADLRLLVIDGSRPLSGEDRAAWEACRGLRTVVALNKTDQPRKVGLAELEQLGLAEVPVAYAAEDGETIPALMDVLASALWQVCGGKPGRNAAGPVTERQSELCILLCGYLLTNRRDDAKEVIADLLFGWKGGGG